MLVWTMKIPNPCCISLPICVKISATTCIVLGLSVIIVQSCLISSSTRIHHSSLLPLYKILREEYYMWKKSIDKSWEQMKLDLSSTKSSSSSASSSNSNATKIENVLRTQLAFNEREGLERILMKEKTIRENLELPNLPDFPEIERISFICGLNGLVGGILELLSSLLLLCSADNIKKSKIVLKIWIAVSGGVIFSMATSLLALLFQSNSVNLNYFAPRQEILFSVLGINLLLLIYFVWINLAYLFIIDKQPLTRLV